MATAGHVERELWALVTDGITAGLPVPSTVWVRGGRFPSVELQVGCPDQLIAWVARLGLRWEPVDLYPGGRNGWQWSVRACRNPAPGSGRVRVQVSYLEALDAPGPVLLPGWLVNLAGVRPAESLMAAA